MAQCLILTLHSRFQVSCKTPGTVHTCLVALTWTEAVVGYLVDFVQYKIGWLDDENA